MGHGVRHRRRERRAGRALPHQTSVSGARVRASGGVVGHVVFPSRVLTVLVAAAFAAPASILTSPEPAAAASITTADAAISAKRAADRVIARRTEIGGLPWRATCKRTATRKSYKCRVRVVEWRCGGTVLVNARTAFAYRVRVRCADD